MPKMNQYLEFMRSRQRRGGPFWRAAYELSSIINPATTEPAFLWNNLLKMDRRKTDQS
jgi:hypothetical protein